MELAKDHATVILNGQGADEALAGYLYIAGFYYRELLRKLKLFKLSKEIHYDVKNHQSYEGFLAFLFFSLPYFIKKHVSTNKIHYLNRDFKKQWRGSDEILNILYTVISR